MIADDEEEILIPVGWYEAHQWQRLEEIAPDVKRIWQSYEEWMTVAVRKLSAPPLGGKRYVKVPIDVEQLLQWCQQQGRAVDAHARAEYAAELLEQQLP